MQNNTFSVEGLFDFLQRLFGQLRRAFSHFDIQGNRFLGYFLLQGISTPFPVNCGYAHSLP